MLSLYMKSLEMYMNDLMIMMIIILIIKKEKKRYYKNIIHLEYVFSLCLNELTLMTNYSLYCCFYLNFDQFL